MPGVRRNSIAPVMLSGSLREWGKVEEGKGGQVYGDRTDSGW